MQVDAWVSEAHSSLEIVLFTEYGWWWKCVGVDAAVSVVVVVVYRRSVSGVRTER